jgi:hypothetical protein
MFTPTAPDAKKTPKTMLKGHHHGMISNPNTWVNNKVDLRSIPRLHPIRFGWQVINHVVGTSH